MNRISDCEQALREYYEIIWASLGKDKGICSSFFYCEYIDK
jgi:hypothetical protein